MGQTTGGKPAIINVPLSMTKYISSDVYSHDNYIDWAAAADCCPPDEPIECGESGAILGVKMSGGRAK